MNLSLSAFVRAFTCSALLIANLNATFAQTAATTATAQAAPVILEKNVRAELGFLASDAMQGRGSATGYERIAAEYIASPFQQFGLEPAGDADASGTRGFTQRVPLETLKFTEAPVLSTGSGTDVHKWQFGRDLLVSFLRVARTTGDLQVIETDGVPTKGAAVVIKLPEGAEPQRDKNSFAKRRRRRPCRDG